MKEKKDSPTRTFYVGKPGATGRIIYDKFEDNMLIRGKKVSPTILELLDAENKRLAGLGDTEVKPIIDYAALKEQRLKLRKREDQLFKQLSRQLSNRRSVYATLCDFAGTNQTLEKKPEEALAKMQVYVCDASEAFNGSDVEDFMEYIETVLERREKETQIRNYRRRRANANT